MSTRTSRLTVGIICIASITLVGLYAIKHAGFMTDHDSIDENTSSPPSSSAESSTSAATDDEGHAYFDADLKNVHHDGNAWTIDLGNSDGETIESPLDVTEKPLALGHTARVYRLNLGSGLAYAIEVLHDGVRTFVATDVRRFAFSDDGRWLATADGSSTVTIVDVTVPVPAILASKHCGHSLRWSEGMLLTASPDSSPANATICAWNTDGSPVGSLDVENVGAGGDENLLMNAHGIVPGMPGVAYVMTLSTQQDPAMRDIINVGACDMVVTDLRDPSRRATLTFDPIVLGGDPVESGNSHYWCAGNRELVFDLDFGDFTFEQPTFSFRVRTFGRDDATGEFTRMLRYSDWHDVQ